VSVIETSTSLATRWNHAGLKLSDEACFNLASLSTLARCSNFKAASSSICRSGLLLGMSCHVLGMADFDSIDGS
jgi:hypothetical protein